jgi:excisionase family DNA binding protein
MEKTEMPENLPKLLKIAEVAAVLQISKTHAYRLLQKGELQCVRFGQTVRVRNSDLETFIDEHHVKKTNERQHI